MMSDGDRELLAKVAPDLMESVDMDGSNLLDQLRARGALTIQQMEHIKVSKQHTAAL